MTPKLSTTEAGELFKAALRYANPLFGRDGNMCPAQWRAWKRLQRIGLATIEGEGEADDLIATTEGRNALITLLGAPQGGRR